MQTYNGWINVHKPLGITSFDVIRRIKYKFKKTKIGHAGTLDPNAEGVLPLAIGKTTKLISLITNYKKVYEFEIKWGEETTTDDRDGKIINTCKRIPSIENIKDNLKKFNGIIFQKPPKVSAVKINGKRAYERFRNKEIFELKERPVEVFNIKLLEQICKDITKIKIECGKGFYVRSFARDLAKTLNTKSHIYSLKRVKVGKFTINNSILLDDLLKISQMAFGIRGFYSSLSMLVDIPAFEIDSDEKLENISKGNKVKIDFSLNKDLIQKNEKNYLAKKNGEIISFGEIEGMFFKPKKVLL